MKIVSIFILFLFVGCGADVVDLNTLCDGSDDVVLGIRSTDYNYIYNERAFFDENGGRFVYINGKCEFWSRGFYPQNISNNYAMRLGIQTGKLTEAQGIELLNLVNWGDWEDFDGDSGGNYVFDSKTSSFSLLAYSETASDSDAEEMADGFNDAVEYLHKIGKPVDDGDLRVYITPVFAQTWWDSPFATNIFFDWPLDPEMISEIGEIQNPYCFGNSFLVTGDAADNLRKQRTDYRAVAAKTFTKTGIIDAVGGKRHFYMRDVLPMENEIGLVPLGGRFDEVLCFE